MSYNIDNWKTKRLEGLTLPVRAFYTSERKDWHPELAVLDVESGRAVLHCGCEQEIHGTITDGQFAVTAFEVMDGEGSMSKEAGRLWASSQRWSRGACA